MADISTTDMLLDPNGPQGAGLPTYAAPPQPQTTPRGGTPAYYIPYNQYNPLQIRPINTQRDIATVQKEYMKQLIPTSVNVRNLALQNLLQRINTPMEGLYGSQLAGVNARQYQQSQDQLQSAMASRGLLNSGAYDLASRQNQLQYLGGMAAATQQARQMEDQRRTASLQQLLGLTESDISFYGGIQGGAVPAGNLFAPQNYGWPQAAAGITQLVKSLASMGAGAAAGGGGGGFSAGADTGGGSQMMGQGGGGAFGGYSGFGGGMGGETYGSQYGPFGGGGGY